MVLVLLLSPSLWVSCDEGLSLGRAPDLRR
jgi:hypothetical protein